MNALIFGATGMVGCETLSGCLDSDGITSITSIVRKPSGVSHAKLTEVIHTDYKDYSSLTAGLSDADICFFCIGVYQNKVSKDKFWEITVGYLSQLILKLEELNPDITFCLFSAQGADPRERSPILFARAKGRAERILFESKLKKSYAFRPGFINPEQKEAFSGFSLSVFRIIYKIFPFLGIDACDLGKVMVDVSIKGNELEIFENRDLRLYAKNLSIT
jgi:uncharacterized protein YbjT (DUF2867 family)